MLVTRFVIGHARVLLMMVSVTRNSFMVLKVIDAFKCHRPSPTVNINVFSVGETPILQKPVGILMIMMIQRQLLRIVLKIRRLCCAVTSVMIGPIPKSWRNV